MPKTTLTDVGTLFNDTSARQAINDNFEAIEQALDNTLSRDGTTPNQMQADLDMNSNDILNVGALYVNELYINGAPGTGGSSGSAASAITIQDTGEFYTSGNVEGALQEVGAALGDIDAFEVGITDSGNNYTSTNVEAALAEIADRVDAISTGGGATTANAVSITDAGNYYTSSTVEGALAQLGPVSTLREDLASSDPNEGTELVIYKTNDTNGVNRVLRDRLSDTASILDFGGLGDNVFDNLTAFTAAEASSYDYIYLPEGTFYYTGAVATLTKKYHGPGKIRFADSSYRASFTRITGRPFNGTGVGMTKFFSSDLTATETRWVENYADRISLTEPYYAPETSDNLRYYNNQSGTSGIEARLTAQLNVGGTSATVNNSTGLLVGHQIKFFNPNNGVQSEQKTITSVVGNVISWTGGIAATYPIGSQVTRGGRTMNSMNHLELAHGGGGDAYINLMRVYVGGVHNPGKDHVFFTNTGGMDGGDIIAQADGIYMTGREILFDGLNYDVAVLGDIRSFSRNNNTGAKEAFWLGSLYKSEGSVATDACHVVSGRWKAALDTAAGFFGDNGHCAINMGGEQRIYFNSSTIPPNTTKLYPMWGEVLGNTSLHYNTTQSAMDLTVNGSLTTRTSDGKHIIVPDVEVQSGRIAGLQLHNHPSGIAGVNTHYVGSGTYTPTLNPSANISSVSTPGEWSYMRVGRVVTVSGTLDLTALVANTFTSFTITLPIASGVLGRTVAGMIVTGDANQVRPGRVLGDNPNGRAIVQITPATNTSAAYAVHFTYLIQ